MGDDLKQRVWLCSGGGGVSGQLGGLWWQGIGGRNHTHLQVRGRQRRLFASQRGGTPLGRTDGAVVLGSRHNGLEGLGPSDLAAMINVFCQPIMHSGA